MNPALSYAAQVLAALPGLIKSGIEVTALINRSTSVINHMGNENRDPTQAEWDELNAEINRLRGELHS